MLSGIRVLPHSICRISSVLRSSSLRAMSSTYTSPYQDIRQTLDYDYHEKCHDSRVRVQDKFITEHLSQPYLESETPMLLLTAGAMGAGKSQYLKTLPFKFILIDPDEIAATIPNYEDIGTSFQVGSDKLQNFERGTKLRHEARLITEILLHASMQRSYDVVLDGSLRSYQWYLGEISKLRQVYPQYRTELVHIHCPLPEVLRRAHRRQGQTGREVPATLIERSWKDSRRAISILGRSKIVDRVRMIDSSGSSPVQIYDSADDPDWPRRGVPNNISPVDGFFERLIENGEDLSKDKVQNKSKL